METRKHIKTAQVSNLSAPAAVATLKDEIYQKNMAGVIFFCSSNYNLSLLGKALEKHFDCPIIGCTTAGEIGTSYTDDSIVAISFSSKAFKLTPMLFENIDQLDQAEIENLASKNSHHPSFKNRVGFLLIDGMSGKEESVIHKIYHTFSPLKIIGGSAGDGLKFEKTFVYTGGTFHNNAAVFTVIETVLDIETFKLQHFEPSDIDFVVTSADPEKRIIYEINGEPAAEYYASLLGTTIKDLSTLSFSVHPTMLKLGDEWYLRSITSSNDDGSLNTACAIETGLPLTVGQAKNITESLDDWASQIKQKFSSISLTLGCDCVSRKLEIIDKGIKDKMEDTLNQFKLYGFNTYGEQYNSIHINQTLTGIVFGTRTF